MPTSTIAGVLAAAMLLGPLARAQQPQRTLEERVAALELEMLAERVDARCSVAPSPLASG